MTRFAALVAALIALLVALLVAPFPGGAATPLLDLPAVGYAYDTPHYAGPTTYTAPERGPPTRGAGSILSTGKQAVDRVSHGSLARPLNAHTGVAFAYDPTANPARDAYGEPADTGAVEVAAGDLSSSRVSRVAANGGFRIVGGGFSAIERYVAETLAGQGRNVVLRQADSAAGRTSDLLVDNVPLRRLLADNWKPRSHRELDREQGDPGSRRRRGP